MLPPNFRGAKDNRSDNGTMVMFPRLHKEAHLRGVLKRWCHWCSTQLVDENLPPNRAPLSTQLLRDPSLRSRAHDRVSIQEP